MSNIDKRALRKKINRRLNDAFGFQRTSGGKHTTISLSIDECRSVLVALDELEAKDNRINRLEAIVAVAEKRNALMREWKRALKVPCDLVDEQVPVVIHGMVIRLERLKETEEKLAAAAAAAAGKGE